MVVTTVDCAIAPVEIIATIAVVSRSLFMLISSPPYAACEKPRMVARFRNKGLAVACFSPGHAAALSTRIAREGTFPLGNRFARWRRALAVQAVVCLFSGVS